MNIGFIGLGNIGYPMAANLISAGFALSVHDRVPTKAEPLVDRGAVWVETPGDLAQAADVLITSLPGPPEVLQVLENENVIGRLRSGSTWIDMSTTSIAQMKRLAATLQERNVTTLECPVTGGVAKAHERKATLFVGVRTAEQ